jgi:hypothetical protein
MAPIGTKRQIRQIRFCQSTFLKLFLMSLFIKKKHILVVSLVAVTLPLLSNSQRSSPVMNAHLPEDKAGGRYCRKFEIMTAIWQQLTLRSSWSYKE